MCIYKKLLFVLLLFLYIYRSGSSRRKDEFAMTKNKFAIAKDEFAITKNEFAIAKDEFAITKDGFLHIQLQQSTCNYIAYATTNADKQI